MKKYLTPCAALLVILLSACDGDDDVVSSSEVATNQIYASMEVHTDGSDIVYVGVQLTKDQPPSDTSSDDEYIALSSADDLWFTSGVNMRDVEIEEDLFTALADLAKTQELVEGTTRYHDHGPFFWSLLFPIQTYYDGSLDEVDDGATYTVSLLREGGIDAKSSTVTMPMPFEIVAPLAGEIFSRSQDSILIEWLPLEEGVVIEVEASTACPDGTLDSYTTTEVTDTGILVLNAGDLISDSLSGSCATELTVAKSRFGQRAPEFVGGFISAHQLRTVSLTTTD